MSSQTVLKLRLQIYTADRECTLKVDPVFTNPCIDQSERLSVDTGVISAMDLKADPCEDFYQYACGGWVKNNPIPDSKWSHKVFTILHEQNQQVVKTVLGDLIAKRKNASSIGITKAAKFYQSCMKTDVIEGLGDEPLKKLIQTYNSWPVTNSSFNPATWNFEDTFTRIHKHLSMAPLFKMFVGEDIKNSSVNIINFDQSGIRMRRDIYLKNGTVHYTARKAYQVLMKKIVRLLGANDTQVKYMDEIYEFEKKLANKFQSVLERRNYRSIYQTMTVAEFANATEIPVEWLKVWLADMFSETNSTVPLSERVVSYSTNYIKSAWKLFNQLKPEVKAAYIMWTPVYTFAGTLRGKYKEAFDEFRKNVYGVTAEAPRWEMCISATSKAFGFALGRLFVDKTFTQGAKDTAEEMIRAIRKVFIENIDNLDWMDQPTKTKAKSKAEGIIQNIGYPNFIKNDTQLNMYYDGLIVHEGKYFENILNRRRFYSLKSYEKRGKPVDKSQWSTLPSQVNAYYFQTKNKIVFPAGILQPPLYDPMAPRALNYGAIGMIVGHEITHGFDDQGKNFNKEGNFQNWWTNSSEKEFDERARCLANQYSRYSLYGKNLNGNQTLGENIADNGGIKEAFQAYRNWVKKNGEEKKLPGIDLTPDQLYFIGFAQIWCSNYRMQAAIHQLEAGVHSISKYRVIGSLHNLEYFAKAYNCPVGSNMNPKEKCSIW